MINRKNSRISQVIENYQMYDAIQSAKYGNFLIYLKLYLFLLECEEKLLHGQLRSIRKNPTQAT